MGWTIASLARGEVTAPGTSGIRGLPITRFYPYEEIGTISRGARLNFDAFGRLALIHDHSFVVLNDATWIDLVDHEASAINMLDVVRAPDGKTYFGALGSWGKVEVTDQGKIRPHSLVPAEFPKWVTPSNFSEIATTSQGICFAGWNGVVYLDYATQTTVYIELTEVSRVFAIRDKLFVSRVNHSLYAIEPATRSARAIESALFDGAVIDQTTALDDGHVIIATIDGRLYLFDGTTVTRWPNQLEGAQPERVSALCRLKDGGLAVAVNGRGLYFLSQEGVIQSVLSNPEYHRITDLATDEPGVIWAATENGLEKVLYGGSVTVFGQRLGIPVSWPQVVQWRGKVIVSSAGRLFEAIPGTSGEVSRFQPLANQPTAGSWAVAASDSELLVGNVKGVYSFQADGSLALVAPFDAARLVMAEPGLCFAIGANEIAAFRLNNGKWSECAPRAPGLGYPSVVHGGTKSAWIELGPNRAARISLAENGIKTKVFETFPWADPHWISISVIGTTVVMSGPTTRRVFFNEKTEAMEDAPELRRLLDSAPYWVGRAHEDAHGTLWASHEHGVFTIKRDSLGNHFDTVTFNFINDRFPLIHILAGGDVWFSTGQSLYHVDRPTATETKRPIRPTLISVIDGHRNTELLRESTSFAPLRKLTYAQNSLSFRFFAGSYAMRLVPMYEFRLNHSRDSWTTLGTGSVLSFSELREGDYHLEVRLTDNRGPLGTPVALDFTILPPLYRSWSAYLLYGVSVALAVIGFIRWSTQHTKARNVMLEGLVEKRTDELKAAMHRLNEETKTAATLAERDRLAGEIHDSLQQGLSGLILQLDATLKLSDLSNDVRSRLSVARSMVSFTRHEVQHAVWDMESPLLAGTELGEALRKITALISPGAAHLEVRVLGHAFPLSSELKHHLLRIAQEAITNAVRHAATHPILIELEYRLNEVVLTISDDGPGFDPRHVLANRLGHFGLRGLQGRAGKINGVLRIDSSPGKGTSISVLVPLGKPAHAIAHSTV